HGSGFLSRFAHKSAKKVTDLLCEGWERVVTRFAMNLSLPEGKELPLGKAPPTLPAGYGAGLKDIHDQALKDLLHQFDSNLQSIDDNVAHNWANLHQRMGFIVELFRGRQQQQILFHAPFKAHQTREIDTGSIPVDIDEHTPDISHQENPSEQALNEAPPVALG
ncbi:MAG: hypothetical protein MK135_13135, partial [Polyangiaceae bacterium]|nr:hypothetical protein [Polyangiaceae bacterium]